jgi:hypothetical protein
MRMEIIGVVQSPRNSYVAVGFSDDEHMVRWVEICTKFAR